MEYIVDGSKYYLSYQQLKELYCEFCEKTNEEFVSSLPQAIHLACIICYLKEIPAYVCLSDKGIVHELAHMMHIPESTDIMSVRKLFKSQLELV